MDQLTQIMKVTGVPGPEFIQKLDTPEVGRTVINMQLCTRSTICTENFYKCPLPLMLNIFL